MKIYRDIFTNDELCADIYTITLVDDLIYEVQGKVVSVTREEEVYDRKEEVDDGERSCEAGVSSETAVDIFLNHNLKKFVVFKDQKSFSIHLKGYMDKLLRQLEEQKSSDQVEIFKTNMNKVMKEISERFKGLQFFTGESMNSNGMVAMCEYREIDGDIVPIYMLFKHGLKVEKY